VTWVWSVRKVCSDDPERICQEQSGDTDCECCDHVVYSWGLFLEHGAVILDHVTAVLQGIN